MQTMTAQKNELPCRCHTSSSSGVRRRGCRDRLHATLVGGRCGGDRGRHGPVRGPGISRPDADGCAAGRLHAAFRRTGGTTTRPATSGSARNRGWDSGIADFSNLDKSGAIMSDQDRVWFFKLGDRFWHSDSSFRPIPAKYSLLSGRIIPSWGANTEFADMRAAYDCAGRAHQAGDRGPGVRTLADVLARGDRVYRVVTRGARGIPPGAPTAGAHASGDRAKVAVPVIACGHDPGLDGAGGAHVPARPDRVRDQGPVRVIRMRGASETW